MAQGIIKPFWNKVYLMALLFSYLAFFCYLFFLKKINLFADINGECYGSCSLISHGLMSLTLTAQLLLSAIPWLFLKKSFGFLKSKIARKFLAAVFFLLSFLLLAISTEITELLALDLNLIKLAPYRKSTHMQVIEFTSPIVAVLQKITIDIVSVFFVLIFVFILMLPLRFFLRAKFF